MLSGIRYKWKDNIIIHLFIPTDAQYEDMFENGNYRRRRRMKRPYRTGVHFSKMFNSEQYPSGPNFTRSVYGTYQPYPRYDPRYEQIAI